MQRRRVCDFELLILQQIIQPIIGNNGTMLPMSKQQQSSFQPDNITTQAVPSAVQMTKTGTKATAEH
jgi:hypothetical protein